MDFIKLTEVNNAIKTLQQFVERTSLKKLSLSNDNNTIYLQLTMKKITLQSQLIKILLPHSVVDQSATLCLFVKDLNRNDRDYSKTISHYKQLLKNANIRLDIEIIPLKQLKTEYQPYEAKRHLSNMFDLYLADERIIRLLPRQLGKHFCARNRYPLQMNVTATELPREIDRVLRSVCCRITARGSCCSVAVAHTGLSVEQTVDNISTCLSKLSLSLLGGGLQNIRSFQLKTSNSPALPIYVNLESRNEVKVRPRKRQHTEEIDDVTTVVHGKVRVTSQGQVQVVNRALTGNKNKKKKM